jgi:hypothetical protein
MIKAKPCLLLSLFLVGCSSTHVAKNQPDGTPAALAGGRQGAEQKLVAQRYSYETVTEAYDGGTKFLELEPVLQE